MDNRNEERKEIERVFIILILLMLALPVFFAVISAAPQGPSIISISNSTKGSSAGAFFNVSGGYISTININATSQNVRWKAFIGNVTGKLTLDDASGSTIYDWSMSMITGEIYATRNSTTPTWANIKCANRSLLEMENTQMSHTNPDDNLTKTFNTTAGASHTAFSVGMVSIGANTCPTLNTYKANSTQDVDFEEMALSDSTNFTEGGNIIYSTIIEQDMLGYNNVSYDFQMIVPENGGSTWASSTAYWLYAELT